MTDTVAAGRIVWHDLMTRDVQSAVSFYTKAVGWGAEPFSIGSGPPYTMWTASGTPLGGVMDLPPNLADMPPHWLAYVNVPNVDDTARRAAELGATVHKEPTDIPTVGRFAIIADPQGANICIWTPLTADAAGDAPPKLGEFSWHELTTTDVPGALAFYTKLFGWTAGPAHDMGPMGIYQIFERNGVQLGGMFTAPADHAMPPNWLGYVRVDSADRAAERVTQNGGKVLNGPMEVPGGSRVAQCQDPQGGMFAVHSM
ncbi:MAG: VOC family protein [Gemmatimonadaceae bacterium]